MALPSFPCCHARCWRLHRGSRQRVLLVGFVGIAGVSRWSSAPTRAILPWASDPAGVRQSNPNVPAWQLMQRRCSERSERSALGGSDMVPGPQQPILANTTTTGPLPYFPLSSSCPESESNVLLACPPLPHPCPNGDHRAWSHLLQHLLHQQLRRQGVARPPASRRMAGGWVVSGEGVHGVVEVCETWKTCRSMARTPQRVLDARCQCNLAVCHGQSALRRVPIAVMAELSWTVSSAVAVAEAASLHCCCFYCCCCLLLAAAVVPRATNAQDRVQRGLGQYNKRDQDAIKPREGGRVEDG